jgi:hypothetical protein
MTMPTRPVMRPPRLKLILPGQRLEKSLAGETTLAAMLTEMVATMTPKTPRPTIQGLPSFAKRSTGSQIGVP